VYPINRYFVIGDYDQLPIAEIPRFVWQLGTIPDVATRYFPMAWPIAEPLN